jgi:hypothetical protein
LVRIAARAPAAVVESRADAAPLAARTVDRATAPPPAASATTRQFAALASNVSSTAWAWAGAAASTAMAATIAVPARRAAFSITGPRS